MTDHQRARRARKSKAFFAKHAQIAALAGNRAEALRLLNWSERKRSQFVLADALDKLEARAAEFFNIVARAA